MMGGSALSFHFLSFDFCCCWPGILTVPGPPFYINSAQPCAAMPVIIIRAIVERPENYEESPGRHLVSFQSFFFSFLKRAAKEIRRPGRTASAPTTRSSGTRANGTVNGAGPATSASASWPSSSAWAQPSPLASTLDVQKEKHPRPFL